MGHRLPKPYDRFVIASLALALIAVARPAAAVVPALPVDFTVEGRVYDVLGAPLTTATDFMIEIVDETTPGCVLYRELRPNVDLSALAPDARGVFSMRFGAVTPDFAAASLTVLLAPGSFTGDGCTATAPNGSHRLIRVSLRPSGATGTYETLTPDTKLTSVPLAQIAVNALTLEGVGTSSLLLLDPTSDLTQGNVAYAFTATNYPRLKALLDGTSTQYLNATPTAAVGLNSQRVTNLADPVAAQDAATKHYVDTTIGGAALDVTGVGTMAGDARVLTWDATAVRWVARAPNTSPTGAAGGDLTGTYPNPQITTNAVTTAKIADNAITAAKIASTGGGVSRLLITDAGSGNTIGYGACTLNQVYAWTALGWACANVSALAPVTSVAGKSGAVTLNAGDVGGLGTAALYDVGTAANKIPQLDAGARLSAVDGSQLTNVNAVTLQTRPVANVAPVVGQYLGWNGSAWTPLATGGGTVTSLGVGAGLTGGPTITTSGTIAVDAGTAANKIVQLTAAAQLPAVDGALLTNVNATFLRARAVAATPPAAGQVLAWNGVTSAWEPTPNGASQWVTNAPNIYYPTGNVGVGTATPAQPLTVVGTAQVDGLLLGASGAKFSTSGTNTMLQPTTANQVGSLLVTPSGTNTTAGIAVSAYPGPGSTNTTSLSQTGSDSSLFNGSPGTLSLGTNGFVSQMVLTGAGRVGLGTNAPAAGLDVQFTGTANSALIIPRDTAANRPSVPVNGMLRYNTSVNAMEGYVNGAWASLVSGTTGTVTNVTGGTGLLGGSINTVGTLSIDVGSAAGKIVKENASAQIAQTTGTVATPSYTFAGDLDTGVFSPGAGQLALTSNGTAALSITAAGNVGVGTTAPTATLQINGSIGSTLKIVDGTQAANRVLTSDANGLTSWQDWGNIIPASNAPAATYGSASQIPVFTTDAYGRVQNVNSTDVTADATKLTNIVPVSKGGTGVSSGAAALVFATPSAAAGAPSFRALVPAEIKASLGYTPVNIAGDTMSGALYTSGALPLGDNALKFGIFSDGTNAGWRANNGPNSDFSFQTFNAGATSMIVRSSGYVGIGTAAPAERLHVNAPSGDAFIKATGVNAGCYMQAGSSSAWNFTAVNGGSARIQVGGNTPAIWLQTSNSVSINTTISNSIFTVAGTISPSVSNTYDLGTSSFLFKNVYAMNANIQTSDRRLKKDVVDSDLGLDFISSLRPVSYRWSTNADDAVHYGLIAQETEAAIIHAKHAPNLAAAGSAIVDYDSTSDRYGLRYSELIAPIIRAVQDLRAWLITTTARTEELAHVAEAHARELARLRERNAGLEAKVEAQARDLASIKRRLGLD